MSAVDTIAAISTAPGKAGIGVVRISGPNALQIGMQMTGKAPVRGHYFFTTFKTRNNSLIDKGLVLFFEAPHSYTGEHIVELQAHGNDIVLGQILEEACRLGARPARPGEFTERAFLNDKIDLVQAEAVIDLIESNSTKAARSAMRSLEGVFSKQINEIQGRLVKAQALLEAALDFPDEEDIDVDIAPAMENLVIVDKLIRDLIVNAQVGASLNKGMHVVIAGKPNAGKSSLLNYLAGNDVAIVSDKPGTTRDRVQQPIQLDGVELLLVDTAGIRESSDEVEIQGIRRSKDSLEKADLVLCVIDNDDDYDDVITLLPETTTRIVVRNKIDINPSPASLLPDAVVHISVQESMGMDDLISAIKNALRLDASDENTVSARQRHIKALQSAGNSIQQALIEIDNHAGYEVSGENIRQALLELDHVLGRVSADDILGVIFSQFCIGK